MIRIIHHRAQCIGCGYCEEIAPYRWKMDPWDGKANLIGSQGKKEIYTTLASDDELQANLEATAHCPVKIIRVEEKSQKD
jgi:ferredoxin